MNKLNRGWKRKLLLVGGLLVGEVVGALSRSTQTNKTASNQVTRPDFSFNNSNKSKYLIYRGVNPKRPMAEAKSSATELAQAHKEKKQKLGDLKQILGDRKLKNGRLLSELIYRNKYDEANKLVEDLGADQFFLADIREFQNQNKHGVTYLMNVISVGSPELAKLIIEYGTYLNLDQVDKDGLSAITYAKENNPEIVELLKEKGASSQEYLHLKHFLRRLKHFLERNNLTVLWLGLGVLNYFLIRYSIILGRQEEIEKDQACDILFKKLEKLKYLDNIKKVRLTKYSQDRDLYGAVFVETEEKDRSRSSDSDSSEIKYRNKHRQYYSIPHRAAFTSINSKSAKRLFIKFKKVYLYFDLLNELQISEFEEREYAAKWKYYLDVGISGFEGIRYHDKWKYYLDVGSYKNEEREFCKIYNLPFSIKTDEARNNTFKLVLKNSDKKSENPTEIIKVGEYTFKINELKKKKTFTVESLIKASEEKKLEALSKEIDEKLTLCTIIPDFDADIKKAGNKLMEIMQNKLKENLSGGFRVGAKKGVTRKELSQNIRIIKNIERQLGNDYEVEVISKVQNLFYKVELIQRSQLDVSEKLRQLQELEGSIVSIYEKLLHKEKLLKQIMKVLKDNETVDTEVEKTVKDITSSVASSISIAPRGNKKASRKENKEEDVKVKTFNDKKDDLISGLCYFESSVEAYIGDFWGNVVKVIYAINNDKNNNGKRVTLKKQAGGLKDLSKADNKQKIELCEIHGNQVHTYTQKTPQEAMIEQLKENLSKLRRQSVLDKIAKEFEDLLTEEVWELIAEIAMQVKIDIAKSGSHSSIKIPQLIPKVMNATDAEKCLLRMALLADQLSKFQEPVRNNNLKSEYEDPKLRLRKSA